MEFKVDTTVNRCKWLSLALTALWLPVCGAAFHFYGTAGVVAATVSAVCCLVAGCITFWTVSGASQSRLQAFAVLIGTLIRGAFALVAVGIMQFLLGLTLENYLVWLSLFYLFSLAMETGLLVRWKSKGAGSGPGQTRLS
jgi:hypothetical protein